VKSKRRLSSPTKGPRLLHLLPKNLPQGPVEKVCDRVVGFKTPATFPVDERLPPPHLP